jgi:hypothetical protein
VVFTAASAGNLIDHTRCRYGDTQSMLRTFCLDAVMSEEPQI